jgi:DNA-binding transcriptional MocR family regulator
MPATLANVREVYAARSQAMADNLRSQLGDAITFTQPQGGLFFWGRLTGANGGPTDATAFSKKAVEQLVAFVPGAPFFAANPDISTLRLSFATADVSKIEDGIARLAKAI